MTAAPDIDVLVIGAGVVGLACARAMAQAGREVVVADRHPAPGMETSSRNSEVIHAGLYYPHNSLKARFCVEGRERLYRYAIEREIPHNRCGKLIVARGTDAAAGLGRIAHAAAAANAGPLKPLTKADVHAIEPDVIADAGLFSPQTGIIDSHSLMHHYLADIERHGGLFAARSDVEQISRRAGGFVITLNGGTVTARAVIASAGLASGSLAQRIEPLPTAFQPTIRFARGVYFRPATSPGFKHLVYPLPTNASLGVHATIDLAGGARFGPDVEWISDPGDYAVDPTRADAFAAAIREYWPAVDDTVLIPDYAGIRPKLVGPGEPPADFRIDGPADHGVPDLICLHGIESPGLTASLALGDYVAGRLAEAPCRPAHLC